MRFAPYSNDHIIYILMYIYIYTYTYEQSFTFFMEPSFDETIFSLTHKSIWQFCCSSQTTRPLVLRLKCEDDHGTCHGQWFCEPCRLRLGRGSVSRMLLLPCTNKAITSKMKANYVCVELRHGLMCFFPASSILFDWFALSKFKTIGRTVEGIWKLHHFRGENPAIQMHLYHEHTHSLTHVSDILLQLQHIIVS